MTQFTYWAKKTLPATRQDPVPTLAAAHHAQGPTDEALSRLPAYLDPPTPNGDCLVHGCQWARSGRRGGGVRKRTRQRGKERERISQAVEEERVRERVSERVNTLPGAIGEQQNSRQVNFT